jgi:hypothetical protein
LATFQINQLEEKQQKITGDLRLATGRMRKSQPRPDDQKSWEDRVVIRAMSWVSWVEEPRPFMGRRRRNTPVLFSSHSLVSSYAAHWPAPTGNQKAREGYGPSDPTAGEYRAGPEGLGNCPT